MKINTKKLVTLAMLGAISIVLVYSVHFPLFPIAPFLEYDPADIPILIGTFLFGPMASLVLTFVVALIQGFTVSAKSGLIGILMHIFATGSFVFVAGSIYRRKATNGSLIVGLICGALAMCISMVLWNILITPIYLGVPLKAVLPLMWPAIIPFNLVKAGVNGMIAYALYKATFKAADKVFHLGISE